MSGYTKGPWSISQRASTAVMDGGGVLVATCGGYQSNMVDPCELLAEQEANARLISSAPDLLEALEMSTLALNDWLSTYAPEMCDDNSVARSSSRIRNRGGTLAYIAEAQAKNRAAIDKARSKS